MSSCGLLFVFIYSSAAVFMIVDGQSTIDDSQNDVSVVDQLVHTITTLRTEFKNLKATLEAEVQTLKATLSSVTVDNRTSGVTYTRWGRLSCEDNGATLLYKGYAAGPHYRRQGGGTNQLCLPEEPQLKNHTKPGVYSGWLYGIEYRVHSPKYPTGTTAYNGKPTPCAVCYVPHRSAQLMIPASNTCPVGWTREYDGYLMADHSRPLDSIHYKSHHGTSYICVDSANEVATGAILQHQAYLYFVRVGCGTLPCSKFTEGLNVPCMVCTK